MQNKSKIIISLVAIMLALIACVGGTYAWFVSSNRLESPDFAVTIGSVDITLEVEIKVNDGEFVKCETQDDFKNIFMNAKPDDNFSFKLTITNGGSSDSYVGVSINEITNTYIGSQYYTDGNLKNDNPNILDYFYLKNGKYTQYDKDNTKVGETDLFTNDCIVDDMNNSNVVLFNEVLINGNGQLVCEFDLYYNYESELQDININIRSISVDAH